MTDQSRARWLILPRELGLTVPPLATGRAQVEPTQPDVSSCKRAVTDAGPRSGNGGAALAFVLPL